MAFSATIPKERHMRIHFWELLRIYKLVNFDIMPPVLATLHFIARHMLSMRDADSSNMTEQDIVNTICAQDYDTTRQFCEELDKISKVIDTCMSSKNKPGQRTVDVATEALTYNDVRMDDIEKFCSLLQSCLAPNDIQQLRVLLSSQVEHCMFAHDFVKNGLELLNGLRANAKQRNAKNLSKFDSHFNEGAKTNTLGWF
jgi:hypothetical protein